MKFLIHKEVPNYEGRHLDDLTKHNTFIHEGEIFEGEPAEAHAYVELLHKDTGVCYAAELYRPPVPEQTGARRRG